MGILRKLPVGLGAAAFEWRASALAAWASTSPPGTAAASRPLVAARNSLRPMAEFSGSFFMRLLDKRSNGVSTNISAALYVTVALKQASKIVFLMDSIGLSATLGRFCSGWRRRRLRVLALGTRKASNQEHKHQNFRGSSPARSDQRASHERISWG